MRLAGYLDAERGVPVVVLQGELDMEGAPTFEEIVQDAEAEHPDLLIVDLRGLTFIDSSGINALLRARERTRARDGRVILVEGRDAIRRVFMITGLENRFEWAEDPATLDLSG